MSKFSMFMKENKKPKEVVKYAPSADFVDENGNKLEWEFKAINSKQLDQLRDDCTRTVGKGKNKTDKFDSRLFNAQLICDCVVYPDLRDSELQSNYGVVGATELLYAMIDNPGEYTDLVQFISKLNGFQVEDQVEEAKN